MTHIHRPDDQGLCACGFDASPGPHIVEVTFPKAPEAFYDYIGATDRADALEMIRARDAALLAPLREEVERLTKECDLLHTAPLCGNHATTWYTMRPTIQTECIWCDLVADKDAAIEDFRANQKDMLAAEAEVARLREALRFYANPDTYRSPSSGFALQYDPMPKPIEIDHGGRAQRALKTL